MPASPGCPCRQHRGVRRHPELRISLAHAGGFLPYASHRLAAAVTADTQRLPFEVLVDLASFSFATALSGYAAVDRGNAAALFPQLAG